MSDCGCSVEIQDRSQSRVLIVLLVINATLFEIEFGLGWIAESTGLIADALDMLADAVVYGIALYAVGRSLAARQQAARLSGLFQILLALGVAADILRRWLFGSEPDPAYMIWVGLLALAANLVCMSLIARHRDGGIHMRASWIFSRNDVIANLGVMFSGALVAWLDSRWPDLLIGALIVSLVLRGGLSILAEARQQTVTG